MLLSGISPLMAEMTYLSASDTVRLLKTDWTKAEGTTTKMTSLSRTMVLTSSEKAILLTSN